MTLPPATRLCATAEVNVRQLDPQFLPSLMQRENGSGVPGSDSCTAANEMRIANLLHGQGCPIVLKRAFCSSSREV
jgi:hypothetical protein